MRKITVDWEFGADFWWEDAKKRQDIPLALRPILQGEEEEIFINDEEATVVERWCESIEGWDKGTAFASHPLLFNPID